MVRSWGLAAGASAGPCPPPAGFPGVVGPRPACRAGWRAGELHTPPCAGRGRSGAQDLPRCSEQCIPQPTPLWRPAAAALTSAGQAALAELAEPRAREGGAPEGPGTAAAQPCGLVPSRESQGKAFPSRKRPGFPAPLQSAQTAHKLVRILVPSAQPRALRAAAFYSPLAFVWVPACTTGYGGVRGRLRSRAPPPATGTPGPLTAELCVDGRRRPALRRALLSPEPAARRRRGRRSPCGSRAVVQPDSHCRRAGAASGAATPGGQFPPLQTAQAWPPAPPLSFLGSSPSSPSLGRSPASRTFEGIPGSPPEGAAKPRLLASSLPPSSSIHLSGTRAQCHASLWAQHPFQL